MKGNAQNWMRIVSIGRFWFWQHWNFMDCYHNCFVI